MRESRSCNDYDPELFQKVKQAVTMKQAAEYYGLKVNRKGLCLCPFHHDTNPSLKIYPNGKGFFCFTCGAGGDPITFAARYRGIRNIEAARELAGAFQVPVQAPATYQEKREAERQRRKRAEIRVFAKRSGMLLMAYYCLLCEAIREKNEHFAEGLQNISWTQYMMEQVETCPEEVYQDRKAVRKIGEIEGRIIDWYIRAGADGSISR